MNDYTFILKQEFREQVSFLCTCTFSSWFEIALLNKPAVPDEHSFLFIQIEFRLF